MSFRSACGQIAHMRNDQRQQRGAEQNRGDGSTWPTNGAFNNERRLPPCLIAHIGRAQQKYDVDETETAGRRERKWTFEQEPIAGEQQERDSDAHNLKVSNVDVAVQKIMALLKNAEQLQVQ